MKSALRSLRILRENWRLTGIAIFSLSIAMAICVLALSVSDTALLAPPAGAAPDRLATIYLSSPGDATGQISYPDYEYYRDHNSVFTGVAAIPEEIAMMRVPTGAAKQAAKPLETFAYNSVSDNYFSVLGIHPMLGRLFAPGDEKARAPIAVMTYSCWKRLGSNPGIVGTLAGSFTIIGVTPKEFTGSLFGLNGDLMVPLGGNDASDRRDHRVLILLARLKPGVNRAQAQADLALLSLQLAAAYPQADKDRRAVVGRATLLPPDSIPAAETATLILLLLVLLVLLIACANVANLLLALAVSRRQEAVIKLALGAPRRRLIREFLREGAILCAASGVVGYAAAAVVAMRYATLTVSIPMVGSYAIGLKLHLGAALVAATIGLALVAMLATGLPAAFYASSPKLEQMLRGEMVVGGKSKAARRNALVVVQVAVSTLALVGMGLCERSLWNLRHENPGFSARNIVTEMLPLREEGYTQAQGEEYYGKVRRAVAAVPGVESAGLGDAPLFGGQQTPVRLPGAAKPIRAGWGVGDTRYFATLGIPLLAGRYFDATDTGPGPDALLVNQELAEKLWPGENAVGRALWTGEPQRRGVVVGVIGNGKFDDLGASAPPYFYYALAQHYQAEISVVARASGDPRLWVQPIARAVAGTGLGTPLAPMTFQEIENLLLLPERIVAGIVAALGGLGLLLAVAGLFGAISYAVSARKKEIGIRVALGAEPWPLLKMVFRETLWVAGAGIGLGIVLGVAGTSFVRSELFGIARVEYSVLLPVAAIMLGISVGVAYVSARPWLRVDPLEAVRHA